MQQDIVIVRVNRPSAVVLPSAVKLAQNLKKRGLLDISDKDLKTLSAMPGASSNVKLAPGDNEIFRYHYDLLKQHPPCQQLMSNPRNMPTITVHDPAPRQALVQANTAGKAGIPAPTFLTDMFENEALAHIAACDDIDQIARWGSNESAGENRESVMAALTERYAQLKLAQGG